MNHFIQLQADETFTEVDDIDISLGKDESATLDDVQPSFMVKSKEVKIEPKLVPKKDNIICNVQISCVMCCTKQTIPSHYEQQHNVTLFLLSLTYC